MTKQWTVEFYQAPNSSKPVEEFIRGLVKNPKLQAKVLRTVDLLAEFGTDLPAPHSLPVTGYEFRELRPRVGSDIARIFYIATKGRRMVLLHGFVKKTRKAPKGDLETAQSRLAELRSREVRK